MSELNLAKGTSIDFPQGKDKLLVFHVTIKPDEGYYRHGARLAAWRLWSMPDAWPGAGRGSSTSASTCPPPTRMTRPRSSA